MSNIPFVTLTHYTPTGFQGQDVVLKEIVDELEQENAGLRLEIARLRKMVERDKNCFHCKSFCVKKGDPCASCRNYDKWEMVEAEDYSRRASDYAGVGMDAGLGLAVEVDAGIESVDFQAHADITLGVK